MWPSNNTLETLFTCIWRNPEIGMEPSLEDLEPYKDKLELLIETEDMLNSFEVFSLAKSYFQNVDLKCLSPSLPNDIGQQSTNGRTFRFQLGNFHKFSENPIVIFRLKEYSESELIQTAMKFREKQQERISFLKEMNSCGERYNAKRLEIHTRIHLGLQDALPITMNSFSMLCRLILQIGEMWSIDQCFFEDCNQFEEVCKLFKVANEKAQAILDEIQSILSEREKIQTFICKGSFPYNQNVYLELCELLKMNPSVTFQEASNSFSLELVYQEFLKEMESLNSILPKFSPLVLPTNVTTGQMAIVLAGSIPTVEHPSSFQEIDESLAELQHDVRLCMEYCQKAFMKMNQYVNTYQAAIQKIDAELKKRALEYKFSNTPLVELLSLCPQFLNDGKVKEQILVDFESLWKRAKDFYEKKKLEIEACYVEKQELSDKITRNQMHTHQIEIRKLQNNAYGSIQKEFQGMYQTQTNHASYMNSLEEATQLLSTFDRLFFSLPKDIRITKAYLALKKMATDGQGNVNTALIRKVLDLADNSSYFSDVEEFLKGLEAIQKSGIGQ